MPTNLSQLSVANGGPFIPPGSAGAGRYRSYIWPDPCDLGQNASTTNGKLGGRNIASGQVGVSGHGYNGGVAALAAIVNGMAGIQMPMTATAGGGISFQGAGIFNLKTSRNNLDASTQDDMSCIRVWANIAATTGSILTQDQGFFVVHAGGINQRLIQDLALGFGFFIGQNNVVSWMVRGPNGLITTNLTSTAGGFDITKHHSYEIIMVSSTQNGDAYLLPLIDSIPQNIPPLSRSWAAGSNLPPNVVASGIANFMTQITADIRSAGTSIHIQQHGIAFGPTLASLQ